MQEFHAGSGFAYLLNGLYRVPPVAVSNANGKKQGKQSLTPAWLLSAN
jgi:hypothetical protein